MPEINKKKTISRRAVLGGAAAATAFTVLQGGRARGQNSKLNVAIIGCGGQGISNMRQLFQLDDCRIAALCDINQDSDYSMFYYGGRAGLQPTLDLVKEAQGEACPTYSDYNEMLDKEDIDAVLVATPDHSHGWVALDVIKKGKHIYLEKPLCRTVEETRVITEAAREAGVASQMGNYGHSSEYLRLVAEWIWDGAIGDIKEVHSWCNTGADRWSKFKAQPEEKPPIPAGFDWDTWLGMMPHRPYHPDYAPVRWRAWWQFGSSTIGDFACHHLDPAFFALKLGEVDRFQVEATQVGMTDETCPSASIINYYFPKRGNMAPVRISWYEGGLQPARPEGYDGNRGLGDHGVMFVGSEGTIIQDGWAGSARIVPAAKMQSYQRPEKTLKRVPGHHQDWLNACKGEGPASTNFDYAGPLTEFALMGNVALRAGQHIDFDWKNMKSDVDSAQQFINSDFADGKKLA